MTAENESGQQIHVINKSGLKTQCVCNDAGPAKTYQNLSVNQMPTAYTFQNLLV